MFEIIISLNAQEDLEKTENHYFKISEKIADKFISNVEKVYKILETNPYFSIRYKNNRAITIDKFPFLMFFEIDEEKKLIYVLSVFHTSRSPEKYPK